MSIKQRRKPDGTKALQVSLTFRNRFTGAQERYRHDAKVQTRAGALDEERTVIGWWKEHGTIANLTGAPSAPVVVPAQQSRTWADAVAQAKACAWPVLKPSTRAGYEKLLDAPALAGWSARPLDGIGAATLAELDGKVADGSDSTRRNYHTVVRAVLRAAVDAGWLADLPRLPPLPRVGTKVVDAADPAHVAKIVHERDANPKSANVQQRRRLRVAFALAAYAGLRASEIRALRWTDVNVKEGTLTVRLASCGGETDTPKSGSERAIPLAPVLAKMLAPLALGREPSDLVACKADGKAWGDAALHHALRRTCARLGLPRIKVHALRHHFATELFAAGVDAKTAQELLGHGSLSVTQRYARSTEARKRAAVQVFATTPKKRRAA